MSSRKGMVRVRRGCCVGLLMLLFGMGPRRLFADSLRLPSAAEVAALGVPEAPRASASPLAPAAVAALTPATVVRSGQGKRFHRPGCKAARGSLAVLGRADALGQGLTACRRCLDVSAARKRPPRPRAAAAAGAKPANSDPKPDAKRAAADDHGNETPPPERSGAAPWDSPGLPLEPGK